MIPLCDWIRDKDRTPVEASVSIQVPLIEDEGPLVQDTPVCDGSDNLEKLRDMVDNLQRQIDEERSLASDRELDLTLRLGSGICRQLAEGLETAFADLQYDLELAVADVLGPFIEQLVDRRAASDLIELVRAEMATTTEQVLEIRAPAYLHPFLETAVKQAGTASILIEAEQIEVIYPDRRARFEDMAARWKEGLRSSQDG